MTHYIKCHFNIFPNHNHDYTYCELYWGCHCGCTWRRACHMLHASQCPALNLSIYKKRNTQTHSISMPELLKRFWCHNSCKILCDLLYSSDVAAETAFLTHTHILSQGDLISLEDARRAWQQNDWRWPFILCESAGAADPLLRRTSVCACRHKGLCCSACCTHTSAHQRSDPPLRAPA